MSVVYIQLFILLCMKVFTKLRKVLRRSGCKTCWCSSSWIFYYTTDFFLPIAVEYYLSVYWLLNATVQFYKHRKGKDENLVKYFTMSDYIVHFCTIFDNIVQDPSISIIFEQYRQLSTNCIKILLFWNFLDNHLMNQKKIN